MQEVDENMVLFHMVRHQIERNIVAVVVVGKHLE